jgi:hypothetical protein
MLADHKSKKFLNHLVRAYMPVTNIEKVWDTPTGDFKCVLTREPLFSLQDILKGVQTEEYKVALMNNLKTMFDENAKTSNPITEVIGDKKMGLTGKDTTTFMTVEAFQSFYDWVMTKVLRGDKHINWLVRGINRNFSDNSTNSPVVQVKETKSSKATYTLGDASEALLKLKEKLENK